MKINQITVNDMNFFGFWTKFYQLLDPDPHSECGSGSRRQISYGSGSETLVKTTFFNPSTTIRYYCNANITF
jgi:hypothetical protein